MAGIGTAARVRQPASPRGHHTRTIDTEGRMRVSRVMTLIAIAGGLAACSGGFSLPMPSLPADTPEFPGSPTTVYTRVARGSNTCWFGPNGTLDRTYIWHAKAEPEAKGGAAEILIHERADLNHRGLKAFSVSITAHGDNAAVVVRNLKMPEAAGQRMTRDAYRWAQGGVGCTAGDTSWAPVAPVPVKAPDGKKPVAKKKSQATTTGPTTSPQIVEKAGSTAKAQERPGAGAPAGIGDTTAQGGPAASRPAR
jgi:hypothetical protein